MKTLLEQAQDAKKQTRSRDYDPEELDLVVAVLRGEVSTRAAAEVCGLKTTGNFAHLAMAVIRSAIRNNKLKLEQVH